MAAVVVVLMLGYVFKQMLYRVLASTRLRVRRIGHAARDAYKCVLPYDGI
jgi:hypothetical protein